MMKDKSTENLTLAGFQQATQTTFRLLLGEGIWVELRLVEVVVRDAASGEQGGGSFSLLFQGPRDPFLPQRMYPSQHEDMGRFDLFIVPISEEKDGFRYEAVFNRQAVPS